MLELIINSAITHTLLLMLPLGCALLLRSARCPGWSVVGGAVAGIILGPSILGRVMPVQFEQAFVGGIAQREALDSVIRRQGADVLAAQVAGYDETRMADLQERHRDERAPLIADLDAARWKFQRPFRSYTSAIIVMAMLGGGLLRIRAGDRRQGWIALLSIGLWSSLLPGALAYAAMTWWWRHGFAESALAAAAVAIGPWVLTKVDREAADAAEFGGAHMIQSAGRIASIIAIIAAGGALYALRGVEGLLWALPLLALPLGWLLPTTQKKGSGVLFELQPAMRALLECAIVPTLAACVAVRVDLFAHFAIWPILVIMILSGDGRWFGALTGALLPGGRRALRTMRLVMGSMACGPTQLAVAAIAAHMWAVPDAIPYALLLGAVLIETTTPARRSVARRLIETEEELAGE